MQATISILIIKILTNFLKMINFYISNIFFKRFLDNIFIKKNFNKINEKILFLFKKNQNI